MSCENSWHSFCWSAIVGRAGCDAETRSVIRHRAAFDVTHVNAESDRANSLQGRLRGRREMNRRALLTCAAIVAGLAVAGSPGSQAQTFPSEPITLIVAWPAGGGSDISMRLIADALSKQIGVPVVVLNKPGAGGAIGHREIVNAKPDGYTIGMFSSGGISLPYLNADANTIDELEPLAFFGEDPSALQVNPSSGISNLKEFVDKARANPGKIRNANDQPGGASFLAAAQYEKAMNFKLAKISYTGYGPSVTALMSGEVDSATVAIPDTIEQHRAGKLRILGVS